ncbi:hypothetical protein ID866_8657 [Astraeus odoratus]|nr:hypothetical protein ID866_8657 [Astraeus odoratus]
MGYGPQISLLTPIAFHLGVVYFRSVTFLQCRTTSSPSSPDMRILGRFVFPFILLSLPTVVWSQCILKIPDNPLTASGLAAPFELTGCNQLDFANEGVFVEASILDPATGQIDIYNPLVINAGMISVNQTNGKQSSKAGFFIPPITPTIPNGSVVALWFGSNANSVTLTGDTNTCFAHCNAPAWFSAATTAVQKGLIKVPAPGTGLAGQACPTTRDFRIVDQDQSDNVDTTYLLIGNNTLAQQTPENAQANPDAEVLSNGVHIRDLTRIAFDFSSQRLITPFSMNLFNLPSVVPLIKIPVQHVRFSIPDVSEMQELQGSLFPPAGGPALVPLNDPMVLVDGKQSLDKVNLYRAGVGQPQADDKNASATTYCQQFAQSGLFISSNEGTFKGVTSPAADEATNLFTFLAMRFSDSFGPAPGLDCVTLLKVENPVNLTTNNDGVVTAAVINTDLLQRILGGTTSSASTAGTPTTSAVTTTSAGHASTTQAAVQTTKSKHSGHKHHTSTSATGPSVSAAASPTSGSASVTATTTHHAVIDGASHANSTPSATSTTGGAYVQTVTVTVTATVCPSQTPVSACISASSARH